METNRKTFYFDTGVIPSDHNPPVPLCTGQILRHTIQIPFDCDDVPSGAKFQFACDRDDIRGPYIVRPIHNSSLISRFAYFQAPATN